MEKMKNNRIYCGLIFAGLFIFLQMQFHHVMVYFDDYGYYSLSYGMNHAAGGHEFGFAELLSYLKVHYSEVNGRIPGYIVWLSLYILGGLNLVQVAAATIVTLILYVIWRFIDSKEYPVISALSVCAFYGLISLRMHQQGTYWFAAFFQYVAPVALIVLFVITYFKARKNGFTTKNTLALLALAFFSSYSQEQLSVTVTFMMCLLLIFELLNRKVKAIHFALILVAVIGVAALLMSTSSQNRATGTGYTLIETIIYSTYKTIRTFFAADIIGLVILLYLSVLIFSAKMFVEDRCIFKLIDLGGVLFSLGSILVYLIAPIRDFLAGYTFNRYYALIAVGVPCVALIAIQIMRYYWKQKQFARLLLFMTAVGSVGCLCVVPEVPPRLFVPSWMLLFPLLFDGLIVFGLTLKEKFDKRGNLCFITVVAVFVFLSAINLGRIYYGYAQNGEVYRYNDQQLSSVALKQHSGESVDEVFLKTLPYPDCAAALIYHKEVVYMKDWIGHYYNFVSTPAFYFSSNGETDDFSLYEDRGFGIYVTVSDS